MSDLSALLDDLRRHEGLRLKPYTDVAGVLSIGYGTNLSGGITIGEAEYLLMNRAQRAIREASSLVTNWYALSHRRQNVLANMAYNLGRAGLASFVKMLAAVEAGEFDLAASEMLSSKWAQQVGTRAVELADAMRNG